MVIHNTLVAPSGGRSLALALAVTFFGLTLLYGWLGYLDNPGTRVKAFDSAYYYMYLRSLAMDQDLDFTNEISTMISADYARQRITAVGRPENNMAVGSALLWTPFFLLGHLATLLSNSLFGAHLPTDGYSEFYQGFVYAGNALYVLFGLLFLARTLCRYVSQPAAAYGCLAALLASPLCYYLWSLTPLAHNGSFFAVALFLYLYTTRGLAITTALAAGLMFLVRWQDILYALPLAWDALAFLAGPGRSAAAPQPLPRRLRQLAGLAASFFLVISPQLISWKLIFGKFVLVPPNVQKIDFMHMHPLTTLFSPADGILAWHPFLLAGFSGLFLLRSKDRKLAVSCILVLIVQFMFIASLQWSAGGSFGMRFFVGGLPFFGLGFGLLYERLKDRAALRRTALVLLVLVALWNQIFVYQYQHHLVSHSRPLTFREHVTDKFRIIAVARSEELFMAGRDACLRNDFHEFSRLARRAYELDPEREKKILALGLAAMLDNDPATARSCFEKLAAQHPSKQIYPRGLALFSPSDATRPPDTSFLHDAFILLTDLQN